MLVLPTSSNFTRVGAAFANLRKYSMDWSYRNRLLSAPALNPNTDCGVGMDDWGCAAGFVCALAEETIAASKVKLTSTGRRTLRRTLRRPSRCGVIRDIRISVVVMAVLQAAIQQS